MSQQLRSLDERPEVLRVIRRRAADRQGWKCYHCGLPMCSTPNCPLQMTLDHVIPVCLGGKGRPGNLVAACKKCNSERHSEFGPMGGGLVATSGEMETESPFAVLGRLNGTTEKARTAKTLRAIEEKEEER